MKVLLRLALAGVISASLGATGAAAAEPSTPLTEWYCADLLRTGPDTTPEHPVHGAVGHTLEWLVLFNLTERDAPAEVTFYFDDKDPATITLTIPAGANEVIGSNVVKSGVSMPMGELHGARVRSPVPLIVQTTRAERETGVKPPAVPGRSFLSRLGYPGPIGQRETAWAYADSHIARANPRHIELEWLTVLNPNPGREARVMVIFNYGATKTTHTFIVEAERVRSVPLEKIEAVRDNGHCGVVVRSDVPIVVEQVRRFTYRAHPAPAGTWIVTGYPIGDLPLRATSSR